MAEEQDLMTEKYGTPLPYDKNFKGPSWRNRSCTDLPCLFIFVLFLGAWGFIANYAFKNGDLNQIFVPTDSFNRKCGLDSKVIDKPFLFFFDLDKCLDPLVTLTGCPTPQICVRQCPTEMFIWDDMKNQLSLEDIKQRLICQSDEDYYRIRTKDDIETLIKNERCARWYSKSRPILNRCMWDFPKDFCELKSPFLSRRNRRHSNFSMTISDNNSLQSAVTNSQLVVQERFIDLCNKESIEKETIIKKKMLQTNTRLVKLVTNVLAHFYNDTHEIQAMGEKIVEDIFQSYWVIITALVLTLIVSLIFIACLRWLAGPLLWLSIIGSLLGLIVALFFTVRQYLFWRDTATIPNHATNIQAVFENAIRDKNNWLYLSIFLSACFLIIFLLVIVLRSRIRIAIALTKEGSKAISCVKSTVFFPIFSWILYILTIAYALAVGLYLGSIGTPEFLMVKQLNPNSPTGQSLEKCVCDSFVNFTVGNSCVPAEFDRYCYIEGTRKPCLETSCSFLNLQNPRHVNWFIGYTVFGFFWLMFFISAFTDMVLAATFATWYWTFKKHSVPYFTLTRAFRQCAFYHLGTVAFGSLILTICRIIRLILEYINSKLKKFDNSVTRAIMCCCRCFFWILESFLRFLNRNAYIMCAIHGKNFCSSAKDAFNLIMRNFLRTMALDKVTDFIFFLSKLLLTGAAGVGTYFFCMNTPELRLNYLAVPTTIVVIFAFLITSVFFDVYGMAVDTLFLCFLEDCERNDGSPEKPYYMSKQLMRILGKRNKRPVSNPKRK